MRGLMRNAYCVIRILVIVLALAVVTGGVAAADGGYSAEQVRVIGRIYQYAEFYGLRDEDRDLLLRIAYRETMFGLERVGDGGFSIGVFQWYRFGVWQSTPCFGEYGWGGRWIEEADVACAAWAFAHGYQSHWRPWVRVRWLVQVPPDPRLK